MRVILIVLLQHALRVEPHELDAVIALGFRGHGPATSITRSAAIPFSRTQRDVHSRHYFSQLILISFSNGLNSGSPVTSSALLSLASAAAKASAYATR